MGKSWPALDVSTRGDTDPELVLAAFDDYSPTAVEEREAALRIFFATPELRERASASLSNQFTLTSIDVDDEDVSLRFGVIQATPFFVSVQVNRQSISGQRELGVDHLNVANEDAGPSLRIELRFLRGGDLRRPFGTCAAVAAKYIVRLRSRPRTAGGLFRAGGSLFRCRRSSRCRLGRTGFSRGIGFLLGYAANCTKTNHRSEQDD